MTKQRTAVPRLLDQHEISALTRLSASRIRQLVASGDFPKPMRATNAKLRRRAGTMVSEIVRCPQSKAARYLEQAEGDVKTAVLLGFGLSRSEAVALLQRHQGNLRAAINACKGSDD